MSAATGDDRLNELGDARVQLLKRWNAPGPDLDQVAIDALETALGTIDAAMAATPADTIAGVMIKACALEQDLREGNQPNVELLIPSLCADLDRLAGGYLLHDARDASR